MSTRLSMLFFVGVILTFFAFSIAFDCRRDAPLCNSHGNCSRTAGSCTCDTDYNDYACFVDQKSVKSSCGNACQNGGTCYGDPENCFCPPEFVGDTCETKRADVECFVDKMAVSIYLHTTPFRVYVIGYKDTAECEAKQDATTGAFKIDINFEGGVCGAGSNETILNDTPNTGDKSYRNFLVILYSSLLQTSLDDFYTITCVVSGNKTKPITGTINANDVDQKNDLKQHETKGTYDSLKLEFLDDKGNILTAAQLGTIIIIRVSLKDTSLYKSLKIESCEAKDAPDSSKSTLMLAENGCVIQTKPAFYIVQSGFESCAIKPDDPPCVSMTIKGFKFLTSENILFTIIVSYCTENDTSCNATRECPLGEHKGRRKRGADENEARLSGSLLIYNPYGRSRTDAMTGSDQVTTQRPEINYGCEKSRDFLVILLTLGATIAVLAAVCMVLALRYIRMRSLIKIEECAPSI